MIVFLDSNVYIGACYHFDNGKFLKLRELIDDGTVSIIYTSATVGEVKKHMQDDLQNEVLKYNRVVRKELAIIKDDRLFELKELDFTVAKSFFEAALNGFFALSGVKQISLNSLDGEALMADYFAGVAPFETKKPYEFKDAIMVRAIKKYQEDCGEPIFVVSNDAGFRRAFEGNSDYICFEYLSGLLKYVERNNLIPRLVESSIDNGDANDVIEAYLMNLKVYRDDYLEWHCEGHSIPEIETSFLYTETKGDNVYAIVAVNAEVLAKITYRDENESYYDKEDHCYYCEEYVTANETHQILFDLALLCKFSDGEPLKVEAFVIEDASQLSGIDLDNNTLFDVDVVNQKSSFDLDLEFCSQCGRPIGKTIEYTTNTYEPLCEDCIKDDTYGFVCPLCGKKYPNELMQNGFCPECADRFDK